MILTRSDECGLRADTADRGAQPPTRRLCRRTFLAMGLVVGGACAAATEQGTVAGAAARDAEVRKPGEQGWFVPTDDAQHTRTTPTR